MFSIWTVIFGLVIGTATGIGTQSTVKSEEFLPTNDPMPISSVPLSSNINSDQLAKCLTKKGAQMYGAFWCPHCAEQKELFGSAVQYIKYTECDARGTDPHPEACVKAHVEAYPTWTMPGGEKLSGTKSLAELAKWSNCPNQA